MEGLTVDLSAANAAFAGAVDAAQLLQASAQAAGINIKLTQEPDDGYWSNVWLKKPWVACYWSGRATEDWMFATAYENGVPWNDTQWDNARFQELLKVGRAELDTEKRRAIYHEMQELCSNDGATVVPMYANYVDAHSTKLNKQRHDWKPLANGRIPYRRTLVVRLTREPTNQLGGHPPDQRENPVIRRGSHYLYSSSPPDTHPTHFSADAHSGAHRCGAHRWTHSGAHRWTPTRSHSPVDAHSRHPLE